MCNFVLVVGYMLYVFYLKLFIVFNGIDFVVMYFVQFIDFFVDYYIFVENDWFYIVIVDWKSDKVGIGKFWNIEEGIFFFCEVFCVYCRVCKGFCGGEYNVVVYFWCFFYYLIVFRCFKFKRFVFFIDYVRFIYFIFLVQGVGVVVINVMFVIWVEESMNNMIIGMVVEDVFCKIVYFFVILVIFDDFVMFF